MSKKQINKELILFMPSIEGGGVEKNFFLISNFLAKKYKNVSVITISNKYRKKFNNSINFITLNSKYWDSFGRRFKYFLSFYLLIKELIKSRKKIVFAFQANIYCIILCKFFCINIITRSNSAPEGWSRNFIKNSIFKFFLSRADQILHNRAK